MNYFEMTVVECCAHCVSEMPALQAVGTVRMTLTGWDCRRRLKATVRVERTAG